jgi:UDP-N-acetylmuramoyl-L-alanyl-D-glutamate--2,6-diaminopimelate ligase
MMRLSDLIRGVEGASVAGDAQIVIREVCDDSRLIEPGDLFIAVPGTRDDGHKFAAEALARGAAALVVEKVPAAPVAVPVVLVPNARRALGIVARNRYSATGELVLSAVTGTSGKTTVTYLLESILAAAGRSPGVMGTVEYRVPGHKEDAPLTTPGALAIHGFFARMRAAGCTDAILEASSHALDQDRLAGCRFRVAALTNVTQDHLDYHDTLDRYFEAKANLYAVMKNLAAD